MTNARHKEISDLIRVWVLRGLEPFVNRPMDENMRHAIYGTLRNAFDTGKQAIEGLGGQEFGLSFDEASGKITLHIDDIPKGVFLKMKV